MKIKNQNNHLYSKIILILTGDFSLNPGPVNRHQIKDHKFDAKDSIFFNLILTVSH